MLRFSFRILDIEVAFQRAEPPIKALHSEVQRLANFLALMTAEVRDLEITALDVLRDVYESLPDTFSRDVLHHVSAEAERVAGEINRQIPQARLNERAVEFRARLPHKIDASSFKALGSECCSNTTGAATEIYDASTWWHLEQYQRLR